MNASDNHDCLSAKTAINKITLIGLYLNVPPPPKKGGKSSRIIDNPAYITAAYSLETTYNFVTLGAIIMIFLKFM